jgi:hypothetical protein
MMVRNALLLTVGVLAGCTVSPVESVRPATGSAPGTVDPSATDHIDANLARLNALDVFEVGQLIVDLPAEAYACYGPCPGSEPAIAQAKAKAATRLAELADTAEKGAATPAADSCAQPAIDRNLAALQALRIVSVSGLIATLPQNNPQCYNLPCSADIAAAKVATCERAGKLGGIVEAAKGL